MTTFRLKKQDGSLIDLAMYAEMDKGVPAITLSERQRSYALSQGRAPEGGNWGVFGDGLEQPSVMTLRIELKRTTEAGITRAWQRTAIEQLQAACLDAVAWQNLFDEREYALRQARLTLESPTETSYFVELTFWETGPSTALGSGVVILPPTGGRQVWRVYTDA
ncbi:hypothetical protein [Deinococcus navajonensis]|uniref:Uncharacterized protein n=1 Tax=Deinococcus navajonensis TaxID=309884 RepID=A0ABV8XKW3_9DEIO